MAQAGIIKTITGNVNARTPDGQVRQLSAGDTVYENEIIETSAGSQVIIELSDGETLALAENSQIVLDETVIAVVDPKDAVFAEVQELQAALEAGEDIPEEGEEPAAGEEDEGHDYDLSYYAGDQSRGEVGSYLFGTEYGDEDDDFPDIGGEKEDTTITEGPEPVFIVGSNPQGQNEETSYDEIRQAQDRYRPLLDDVENPVEDDSHTVNPAGDNVQGAIIGQGAADILVGDPGSVTPEHSINNYIMVLDYSRSVSDDSTSLDNLIAATKNSIQILYSRVEHAADGYEVTINLLPFAGEADADNNSAAISFVKNGDDVDIEISINNGMAETGSIDDILDWIDNSTTSLELGDLGLTNYYSAFTEAQQLVDASWGVHNSVIFISDGSPNIGGDYLPAHSTLAGMVDSIRAVGVDINPSGIPALIMNGIDTEGPAANIESDQLSDVIVDLTPQDVYLDDTGSDNIYGNDGNDLIFGDVLNTDGVFADIAADHDLTGIDEPPDGSGWQVFEILENEVSTWTRADTIQYIQENHETLAQETVQEDKWGPGYDDDRWGGYDNIDGGDGNDIIYGQEGNDDIDAGAGDDIIDGGSGNDTIDAGSGNDVVDGGTGFDTLIVDNDTTLDFGNVSNIERIELNEDSVDQTLTLSLNDVMNMTDEDHVLQITGEAGDSVSLTGVDSGEWINSGGGLFTNAADNTIQVTIASVSDGVDIDVNVDDGDSFQV